MNDRYLFKAKRGDNTEWVQGYYFKKKCTDYQDVDNNIQNEIHFIYNETAHKVIPETVCQCTGEKVANDQLVWEFDKLNFTVFDCFGGDVQYLGVVEWGYGEYMLYVNDKTYFNLYWVLQQDDEAEITGNIHDEATK